MRAERWKKVAMLGLALLSAGSLAQAQQPTAHRSGGQPIEIVSDRLQVDQDQQIATFTGNVNAVQGEMTLRSNLLRVFYADSGKSQGGGKSQNAGSAGGGAQSIKRIEAEGDVVLTQPGETAQGDRGVYDPVAETLVLESNVVLTRGENVVRGSRLDSNLATGVSVVSAQPGKRVRALFVQEQQPSEGRP